MSPDERVWGASADFVNQHLPEAPPTRAMMGWTPKPGEAFALCDQCDTACPYACGVCFAGIHFEPSPHTDRHPNNCFGENYLHRWYVVTSVGPGEEDWWDG